VYYTEKSLILRIAKLGVFFHITKHLRLYIKVTDSLRIVPIVIAHQNVIQRYATDLIDYLSIFCHSSKK